MKSHVVSDNNCNIVNPQYPPKKNASKEWQVMVCLHLVLLTLHGRFAFSIEQDK